MGQKKGVEVKQSFIQDNQNLILKDFITLSIINLFVSVAGMFMLNILIAKDLKKFFNVNISYYIIALCIIEILIILAIFIKYFFKKIQLSRNYEQMGSGTSKKIDSVEYDNNYDREDVNTYDFLSEFDVENLDKNYSRGYVFGSKSDSVLLINSNQEDSAIVEGAVGCGKTEFVLKPTLFNLSVPLKNVEQESMFILDPKGDLCSHFYKVLQSSGYDVMVVNLINPLYSSKFNPLETISNLNDEINIIKYNAKLENRNLNENEIAVIVELEDDLNSFVTSFATLLTNDPTAKEKIWSVSAKEVLISYVYFTMHFINEVELDGLNSFLENSNIEEKERLNLKSYVAQKNENFTKLNVTSMVMLMQDLLNDDLLDFAMSTLPIYSKGALHYSVIAGTSGATKSSIITTLLSNLSVMFDSGISSLTSSSDIDLEKLDEGKPKAIFLVVPDEDKSRHFLGSIFLEQVYASLRRTARTRKNLRLNRTFHFILEEVPNACDILNFTEKVSVARSQNIRFLNLLQSKDQLVQKYGKETTDNIYTNCLMKMYLLLVTANRIKDVMELSGEKAITNEVRTFKGSSSNLQSVATSLKELPVLSFSKIRELQKGHCIVEIARYPFLETYLIPAYQMINFERIDLKTINSTNYIDLENLVILPHLKQEMSFKASLDE